MYLDRQIGEFVNKLEQQKSKPINELTPQEARGVLRTIQKQEGDLALSDSSEFIVPLKDKRKMRVVIVKPVETFHDLPVIFYIHGGGWVMGDEKTHANLIRKLANLSGAAVVFPVYEPSPESQYPQTTNDLFEVLKHIANFGDKYHLDAERLAVAGDSVGGNMAVVMSLMAKDNQNKPKILQQVLFYPVTNAEFETESYEQFQDGPWLTREAMKWFWDQYAPDKSARKEIYASLLKAEIEDLRGLPPTLIITAENDVLRDEGESFAEKLNLSDVDVCCARFNGTIHDFVMLNDIQSAPPAQAAVLLAAKTLKQTFAQASKK